MLEVESEPHAGEAMHRFIRDVFPLCRSLTGEGVRATLQAIGAHIPLDRHEVPSSTPVLDWTVPDEWTVRGARIKRLNGEVLVDFARSNLHVVGYSLPINRVVTRDELARHVHTLPQQPDLIPYRTAYYAQTWGFCLSHSLWETMRDEAYRVVIDSDLKPGSLTYGECFLPGEEDETILISAHCCHPSLANDNLSGLAVAAWLAQVWEKRKRRYGVRFLFLPATIGAITWLARNPHEVDRVKHGLVLTCVGDTGRFHYKQSRQGDAVIDRTVVAVLKERGLAHTVLPFAPFGYDERQYGAPGYNLPVGCFMRSPNGTFPEYHTSADTPEFVEPKALQESFEVLDALIGALMKEQAGGAGDAPKQGEADSYIRCDGGYGEPQLGRRGLYALIGGAGAEVTQASLLWVLNLADGYHSPRMMAERSGLSLQDIEAALALACRHGLIEKHGVVKQARNGQDGFVVSNHLV